MARMKVSRHEITKSGTGHVWADRTGSGMWDPSIWPGFGGMTDIVRPRITGLLAEPEDVRDLRNAIITLIDDSNLRHELSLSCRQIATKEYGLELQAGRYIKLYGSLLKQCKVSTLDHRPPGFARN